jgi:hypothetical protein
MCRVGMMVESEKRMMVRMMGAMMRGFYAPPVLLCSV